MSRVGVISDTHDNIVNVRKAVELFNDLGLERVVHCGDIIAQFVLAEFKRLEVPLVAVFGNCDGDRNALQQRAGEFDCRIVAGPTSFESGGHRFVVTHEPLVAVPNCEYYLHGHTHALKHDPGPPAVVNPGEACGYLTGRSTVAVVDTDSSTVRFIDL
jgi:hypothetical protein